MAGYTGPTLPSSGNTQADGVFRRLVDWLMSTPMQGHLNSDLASISDLTPADGTIIVGDGTDWVAETGATARTSLGLAIGTDVQAFDADLSAVAGLASSGLIARTGAGTAAARTLTAGSNIDVTNGDGVAANPTIAVTAGVFQPLDAQLTDVAGLAVTDGNFIVGNGANFVAESGATARTSLGLGTIATQAASAVAITGGSVTGITDLAVADGGTGAGTAADARTNLGLGAAAVQDYAEGTWTPTLTFATPGNLSVVYSTQVGVYTKVGRLVTVSFFILTSTFTHTTASGECLITGLPFTARTLTDGFWYGTLAVGGVTKANYTSFNARAISASDTLAMVASGSGQGHAFINAADMPTGGTARLLGQVTYEV